MVRAAMEKKKYCSAVVGSEVVYSRELQVRPIRKLQPLFKKIRLGLESALVVDNGIRNETEIEHVGQSSHDVNMGNDRPASPQYSPSIGPATDAQPGAVKVECLDGCFKKDDLRIRDVGQMADMLTESARKLLLFEKDNTLFVAQAKI